MLTFLRRYDCADADLPATWDAAVATLEAAGVDLDALPVVELTGNTVCAWASVDEHSPSGACSAALTVDSAAKRRVAVDATALSAEQAIGYVRARVGSRAPADLALWKAEPIRQGWRVCACDKAGAALAAWDCDGNSATSVSL